MPGSIQWIGSPNFAKGRQGYQPLAIVIHIMQGTLADTDSWFNAVKSQVSAHYGVGKDGSVHQYVGEGDTAWHAGRVNAPTWPLLRPGVNPNWYTIGIEHEGQSGVAWTDDMYAASASLVAAAANRWGIALDRQHIIGHHEIYSLKPFCPGDGVDLDHVIMLAQQGVQSIASYAFVAKPGAVHTISALNVRRAAPTTAATIVRTVDSGTDLAFGGWTSNGQSVHGNAHWYRDNDGNFFWAGATDCPTPSPG